MTGDHNASVPLYEGQKYTITLEIPDPSGEDYIVDRYTWDADEDNPATANVDYLGLSYSGAIPGGPVTIKIFVDGIPDGNETFQYVYSAQWLDAGAISHATDWVWTFTILDAKNEPGTAGPDSIIGTPGNDVLHGGVGQDRLEGGDGEDTLYGEDNNDRLYGGDGADLMQGAASNDRLYGGAGADTLNGGSGADFLDGEAGVDRLVGGPGRDWYVVDSSDEVVVEKKNDPGLDRIDFTQPGTYRLPANVEEAVLASGGGGNLIGTRGNETLFGDPLNNRLEGRGGNDRLLGSYASTGESGRDTLLGGAGDDVLNGLGGGDRLNGGEGNDTVDMYLARSGTSANLNTGKIVEGSSAPYTLVSIENLKGGSYADLIIGNEIANYLDGSSGSDTLVGGAGTDTLSGGSFLPQPDCYRFSEAGDVNADTIVEMQHGLDRIQLDDAFFAMLVPAANGALSAANFHVGAAAGDGDDYVVFDATTRRLYYDSDGSGAAMQQLIATITSLAGGDLSASDFEVI